METNRFFKGRPVFSAPRLKIALFAALFLAAAAAARIWGMPEFLSVARLRESLDSAGFWAPAMFIAIYAAASSLGVPGTVLTIVGGVVFGKWHGTLYNVIGATLGASGGFFIARFLAGDAVARRLAGKKWFRRFNEGLDRDGLYFMLFVRLVPVFPYNGINFGAGLTKMPFRDFFLGTALGILPGAFIFTNAAAELGESAVHGFRPTSGMAVSLALLGLFALVPVFVRRKYGGGTEK